MKHYLTSLGLFASVSVALHAAPPSWWSAPVTPATPIIGPATPSGSAPANLGQLKHVAKMAKIHLDQKFAAVGGAGPEIDALVASFEPRQGQGYTPAQIAVFQAANYAPINLGQLKQVAKPFYQRLVALGYNTKVNLIGHLYPSGWAYYYPWNPNDLWNQPGNSDKTINYRPANLGQVKMTFSFDALGFTPNLDADADSLPNDWEFAYGLDPFSTAGTNGANGNRDGDLVLNFQDVRPDDPGVGALSVSITTPTENAVIP